MNLQWEDKVWGRTRELIDSPFYAKYELDVIAGGYCSLHYHQQRANRFIVGTAQICVSLLYGPKIDKYFLGPDNVLDVPSFVPHIFCVYTSGLLFEEYYPDRGGIVQRNDIVRLYEGGWLDVSALDDILPRVILPIFSAQH